MITGAPGVGKSTICRMASARLECAAHIEADELHRMIVTGAEWPNAGTPDSQAQLLLRTRNAAQVAANFSDAGITPIVDEVIATHEQLDILDEILAGANVTFVVLGASAQAILERDAGRHKHTAAHYLGVDQLVSGVLAGRAAFLDTTELSPEETVNAVQGIVPNVGWLAT
ncbi:MAG TPA: AAA family ATPase [Acidimicrobiales bacterium]|nr:AAA family ATPase [Acidimicrobiales bacterium]